MSEMPPDPLEPDEDGALGVMGAVLAEADLLMSALREAQQRGRLREAVFALSVADLRAVVFERVLTEALRDGWGERR